MFVLPANLSNPFSPGKTGYFRGVAKVSWEARWAIGDPAITLEVRLDETAIWPASGQAGATRAPTI